MRLGFQGLHCPTEFFCQVQEVSRPSHKINPVPPMDEINKSCSMKQAKGLFCLDVHIFYLAYIMLSENGSLSAPWLNQP